MPARAMGISARTIWLGAAWVCPLFAAGESLAQVESTGFEPEDGWDAGSSVCGAEFAPTCSYPVANVCIPDDHAANENCCSLDPNVDTGWYMADDSRHCHKPQIATAHPSSGGQHLRFERDPAGTGNLTACTPSQPAQPPGRTILSFDVSGSGTGGSTLEFVALADDDPSGSLAARLIFDAGGSLYFEPHDAGPWHVGAYRNVRLELDPDRNTVRFCYGGQLVSLNEFDEFQARTVQRAIFQADNGGRVWDIDNYEVTRGASGVAPCGVNTAECGPGPCVALKAVAVKGEPISPRSVVYARPSDVISAETYVSGWGAALAELRLYQTSLYLRIPATSGTSGTILPFGWDAPLQRVECGADPDCPPAHPVCSPLFSFCTGPDHDPESGVAIDTARADFALAGITPLLLAEDVAHLDVFRVFALAEDSTGAVDPGGARYAASQTLVVSEDACGAFTFEFERAQTFFADAMLDPTVVHPATRSLVVHVCADDGLYCNGLESCASGTCVITPPANCDDGNVCTADICIESVDACGYLAVCGACCDAWDGTCTDEVAEPDCNCPQCQWHPAAECADIVCETVFVVIPTVSQWGAVVLALLLLIGEKVAFGRRAGLHAPPTRGDATIGS